MNESTTSPRMYRLGVVLSVLIVLFMVADAIVGFFFPSLLAQEMAQTGWALSRSPLIAALALACVVIYAVPRTAILGAILLTAFFGGAIATHARVDAVPSPPMLICLLAAILTWSGLYFRDARLRRLLPLQRVTAT